MRRNRRRLMGELAALLVLSAGAPAGAAATSVTIDAAARSGSTLVVSGGSTYANQPFVSLGSDPAGDATAPGVEFTGKDVTGFSMSTNTDGSVTLRWHLSQLPPGLDRGVDVGYSKAFCVTPSDEPNCWVIIFVDVAGAPLTNPFVEGWKCPDETCQIGSADWIHTWETDRYDVPSKTALASVPASDIGLTPGSRLVAVYPPSFGGPVFVTTPWWFLGTDGLYPTYDGTAIDGDFQVAAQEVALAVGPSEQAPDQVSYATNATIAEDGRYEGELDVSSLQPGPATVYARACFGANNCAYAIRDQTI